MSEAVIEAKGLVKKYGQLEAVRGIDLEVKQGEIFGFLGPNGAGKSTTISMLCTLLKPTAGSASVAGIDVVHDPARVRQRIGLVFQDPSLDDQLTGRENLEFHAFIYSVPAEHRRERIDMMLELLQLSDRASSQVRTYSGGMKRRLEIARGMLHEPQILFLDEPTLGLDPQTRRNIWTHLNDLRARTGVTIFMTTHYMDEAEFCDRIAIIDKGQIVALGTPDQLKAMVGGDVVTMTSSKAEDAVEEIQKVRGEPARGLHHLVPRHPSLLERPVAVGGLAGAAAAVPGGLRLRPELIAGQRRGVRVAQRPLLHPVRVPGHHRDVDPVHLDLRRDVDRVGP